MKKVDKMTGKLIYGRNEAVDIDTESDFQIANILMKMRMENQ